MKRFALFASDSYYPKGGAYDFRAWFDTIEDAEAFLADAANFKGGASADWAHVWDTESGDVVASYDLVPAQHDWSGTRGGTRPREVRKL